MSSVIHRRLLASLLTLAAFAVPAAPAYAASAAETVTGTTTGTIALVAGTGAVFSTGFAPGSTANATGVLTATSTNPSWALTVQDNGAGAGHMVASAPALCGGSDSQLTNALQVGVNSPLANMQSAGVKTISGSPVTVASATNQLLAANVLTTNYTQVIPSSQLMAAGCPYQLTATYTLQ